MTNSELQKRIDNLTNEVSDIKDNVERKISKHLLNIMGLEKRVEEIENLVKFHTRQIDGLIDAVANLNKKAADSSLYHKFQVGDRVQFKSWEELEKENISLYTISSKILDKLVGTYATIQEIDGTFMKSARLADFSINDNTAFLEGYFYNLDMLKPATDEPKCKFKVGDKVIYCPLNYSAIITRIVEDKYGIVYDVDFSDGIGSAICGEEKIKPSTEPRWNFTDDEKVILRNLPEEYKWIARDVDGNIFAYKYPVSKKGNSWYPIVGGFEYDIIKCFNHLFQSIKWEDDQACEFRKYI